MKRFPEDQYIGSPEYDPDKFYNGAVNPLAFPVKALVLCWLLLILALVVAVLALPTWAARWLGASSWLDLYIVLAENPSIAGCLGGFLLGGAVVLLVAIGAADAWERGV